jgi:hypothetical protein
VQVENPREVGYSEIQVSGNPDGNMENEETLFAVEYVTLRNTKCGNADESLLCSSKRNYQPPQNRCCDEKHEMW